MSDEDKETKKKVQDELLERFEEGLAHTMRPVTPLSVPSGRLFRLLLYVLHGSVWHIGILKVSWVSCVVRIGCTYLTARV